MAFAETERKKVHHKKEVYRLHDQELEGKRNKLDILGSNFTAPKLISQLRSNDFKSIDY